MSSRIPSPHSTGPDIARLYAMFLLLQCWLARKTSLFIPDDVTASWLGTSVTSNLKRHIVEAINLYFGDHAGEAGDGSNGVPPCIYAYYIDYRREGELLSLRQSLLTASPRFLDTIANSQHDGITVMSSYINHVMSLTFDLDCLRCVESDRNW